jgi:hypothetical protein
LEELAFITYESQKPIFWLDKEEGEEEEKEEEEEEEEEEEDEEDEEEEDKEEYDITLTVDLKTLLELLNKKPN